MSNTLTGKPRVYKDGSKIKLSHMEYYQPDIAVNLERLNKPAKEVEEDIQFNNDDNLKGRKKSVRFANDPIKELFGKFVDEKDLWKSYEGVPLRIDIKDANDENSLLRNEIEALRLKLKSKQSVLLTKKLKTQKALEEMKTQVEIASKQYQIDTNTTIKKHSSYLIKCGKTKSLKKKINTLKKRIANNKLTLDHIKKHCESTKEMYVTRHDIVTNKSNLHQEEIDIQRDELRKRIVNYKDDREHLSRIIEEVSDNYRKQTTSAKEVGASIKVLVDAVREGTRHELMQHGVVSVELINSKVKNATELLGIAGGDLDQFATVTPRPYPSHLLEPTTDDNEDKDGQPASSSEPLDKDTQQTNTNTKATEGRPVSEGINNNTEGKSKSTLRFRERKKNLNMLLKLVSSRQKRFKDDTSRFVIARLSLLKRLRNRLSHNLQEAMAAEGRSGGVTEEALVTRQLQVMDADARWNLAIKARAGGVKDDNLQNHVAKQINLDVRKQSALLAAVSMSTKKNKNKPVPPKGEKSKISSSPSPGRRLTPGKTGNRTKMVQKTPSFIDTSTTTISLSSRNEDLFAIQEKNAVKYEQEQAAYRALTYASIHQAALWSSDDIIGETSLDAESMMDIAEDEEEDDPTEILEVARDANMHIENLNYRMSLHEDDEADVEPQLYNTSGYDYSFTDDQNPEPFVGIQLQAPRPPDTVGDDENVNQDDISKSEEIQQALKVTTTQETSSSTGQKKGGGGFNGLLFKSMFSFGMKKKNKDNNEGSTDSVDNPAFTSSAPELRSAEDESDPTLKPAKSLAKSRWGMLSLFKREISSMNMNVKNADTVTTPDITKGVSSTGLAIGTPTAMKPGEPRPNSASTSALPSTPVLTKEQDANNNNVQTPTQPIPNKEEEDTPLHGGPAERLDTPNMMKTDEASESVNMTLTSPDSPSPAAPLQTPALMGQKEVPTTTTTKQEEIAINSTTTTPKGGQLDSRMVSVAANASTQDAVIGSALEEPSLISIPDASVTLPGDKTVEIGSSVLRTPQSSIGSVSVDLATFASLPNDERNLDAFHVKVSRYGLGLRLGKAPDGHAIVKGFKELPDHVEHPTEGLLIKGDVIVGVNTIHTRTAQDLATTLTNIFEQNHTSMILVVLRDRNYVPSASTSKATDTFKASASNSVDSAVATPTNVDDKKSITSKSHVSAASSAASTTSSVNNDKVASTTSASAADASTSKASSIVATSASETATETKTGSETETSGMVTATDTSGMVTATDTGDLSVQSADESMTSIDLAPYKHLETDGYSLNAVIIEKGDNGLGITVGKNSDNKPIINKLMDIEDNPCEGLLYPGDIICSIQNIPTHTVKDVKRIFSTIQSTSILFVTLTLHESTQEGSVASNSISSSSYTSSSIATSTTSNAYQRRPAHAFGYEMVVQTVTRQYYFAPVYPANYTMDVDVTETETDGNNDNNAGDTGENENDEGGLTRVSSLAATSVGGVEDDDEEEDDDEDDDDDEEDESEEESGWPSSNGDEEDSDDVGSIDVGGFEYLEDDNNVLKICIVEMTEYGLGLKLGKTENGKPMVKDLKDMEPHENPCEGLLIPGDVIVAVNNEAVDTASEIGAKIQEGDSDQVMFFVLRDRELDDSDEEDSDDDSESGTISVKTGATGVTAISGVTMDSGLKRISRSLSTAPSKRRRISIKKDGEVIKSRGRKSLMQGSVATKTLSSPTGTESLLASNNPSQLMSQSQSQSGTGTGTGTLEEEYDLEQFLHLENSEYGLRPVLIERGDHGLGIIMAKDDRGRAVVKGFKELPEHIEHPSEGLLLPGDVIVGVNGEKSDTPKQVAKVIGKLSPKDELVFVILRHNDLDSDYSVGLSTLNGLKEGLQSQSISLSQSLHGSSSSGSSRPLLKKKKQGSAVLAGSSLEASTSLDKVAEKGENGDEESDREEDDDEEEEESTEVEESTVGGSGTSVASNDQSEVAPPIDPVTVAPEVKPPYQNTGCDAESTAADTAADTAVDTAVDTVQSSLGIFDVRKFEHFEDNEHVLKAVIVPLIPEGLGLKLGKYKDGKAKVKGFEPIEGVEHPTADLLKQHDIIIGVNDLIVESPEEVINAILAINDKEVIFVVLRNTDDASVSTRASTMATSVDASASIHVKNSDVLMGQASQSTGEEEEDSDDSDDDDDESAETYDVEKFEHLEDEEHILKAVLIEKGRMGLGLNLKKNDQGQAVVKTLKELPNGEENPAEGLLKPGDIIVGINDEFIDSPQGVVEEINKSPSDECVFVVLRHYEMDSDDDVLIIAFSLVSSTYSKEWVMLCKEGTKEQFVLPQ